MATSHAVSLGLHHGNMGIRGIHTSGMMPRSPKMNNTEMSWQSILSIENAQPRAKWGAYSAAYIPGWGKKLVGTWQGGMAAVDVSWTYDVDSQQESSDEADNDVGPVIVV